MSIKLLVADHDEIALAGIRVLLNGADVEIVGEARTGTELLRLFEETKPDVVLLEALLPDQDGLQVLERIRRITFEAPVLFFSAHEVPGYIARAVAMGANGYVLKSADSSELSEAIRRASVGDDTWTKRLLRQVSSALRLGLSSAGVDTDGLLTPRENEVLQLVTAGLKNKQIADKLGISSETIKEHVQNILRKVGVSDRTQAAVWAVRNGIA
jgi:DNA-binding NarL/FixJ family response regulator